MNKGKQGLSDVIRETVVISDLSINEFKNNNNFNVTYGWVTIGKEIQVRCADATTRYISNWATIQ
jgi:hypothetical protein